MTLQEFLDQMSASFTAAVVSIDAVGSSRWGGTNADIVATRTALREFVDDVFHAERAAFLRWEADGGLLLCDGSERAKTCRTPNAFTTGTATSFCCVGGR